MCCGSVYYSSAVLNLKGSIFPCLVISPPPPPPHLQIRLPFQNGNSSVSVAYKPGLSEYKKLLWQESQWLIDCGKALRSCLFAKYMFDIG